MAKKGASTSGSKSKKAQKIERTIVENLIELQKVHVNLVEKFDKLASEISQLLSLFELAARSFASNQNVKATEKDNEFLDKINRLLDQNKTIAKGLSLMEEKIRERMYGSQAQPAQQPTQRKEESEYEPSMGSNRPLPKF